MKEKHNLRKTKLKKQEFKEKTKTKF